MKAHNLSEDQMELTIAEPNTNRPRRTGALLPFAGAVLVFLVVSTSFCAYQTWNTKTHVNLIVYPDKESDTIKIKIEGNIDITSKKEEQPEQVEATCGVTRDEDKFECHPEPNPSEDRCLARGCCWSSGVAGRDPNAPVDRRLDQKVYSVGVPVCYYPTGFTGYKVVRTSEFRSGLLTRLRRVTPSGFPKDIKEVQVKVTFLDENRVNIKISDPNTLRYEVPFPKLRKDVKGKLHDHRNKYHVTVSRDGVLAVSRKSTGVNVFKANLATMIFADQLLQLNIRVPFKGFYGIGESEDTLLRGYDWKRYVLFNRDRAPEKDLNLYGSHPFYLQMEDDNGHNSNAHGVFLFNSNPMDIVTQPSPAITFRPIGGVFDFYIFMGPSPSEVVKQYVGLIGHSHMPPYWSLGFHLCRWGYGTVEETRRIWLRNREAKIPFDVQWNDIDYMEHYNDFTVDPVAFKALGSFVDELHDVGMHYVMIMDVGIGGPDLAGTYPPYDDAVEMDCLVKNVTGDILVGKVWNNGSTVFPDYTHPRAGEYMTKQYQRLHDIMQFDGSWTDMNEPSNFLYGSEEGCPADNPLDNPPYIPGNLEPLPTKTLCMSAQHHASSHYNIHNIHGLTNVIATNEALKNVRKRRPFIITRSSAPGVGLFGGHWDGDIFSTWDHYRWTIPSILNFGMFGVSMMGADICGFNGDTEVELCARWQSMGAFYPFSRNHNTLGAADQDPAGLGGVVLESTRNSLRIRYKLLPFLYTLFYRSHVHAETVARPLFFEYPNDPKTYAIDSVFLWGPSLMIIPVLEANQTDVSAYIPRDAWYDYHTGRRTESGGTVIFDAPLDKINLLVRGGHILPTQEPSLTTTDSRKNKFGLLVALKEGKAEGELFWDDGDSLDTYNNYNLIRFDAANKVLKSKVESKSYSTSMVLGEIDILGTEGPSSVIVNGREVKDYEYDGETKVLKISNLSLTLLEEFTVEWK